MPKIVSGEPPKKQFVVTERVAPSNLGEVPSSISEYFQARGIRVYLDNADGRVVPQRAAQGRYPITIEDLDPDQREAILADLRRNGFRKDADGTFGRGDCLIYCQTWRDREHWEKVEQEDYLRQIAPSATADAMAEKAEAFGLRLDRERSLIPDPREHVGHGE